MTQFESPPPRLLQGVGPAADCVRTVLARQDLVLTLPRFATLRERRLRRLRRQRSLSALVIGAAALLSLRLLPEEESATGIRPEPSLRAERRDAAPSTPPPPIEATAVAVPPLVAETPAVVGRRITPARREASSPPKRSAAAPALDAHEAANSTPAPTASTEPNGGAKACAQLARSGASEQALECYQKLASSDGMTAELALFEQARIEGKVLHRPDRALLTLDSYRRRFPGGSLRGEVMLAQIDWLLAAGKRSEALRVVNEALDSGLLSERTAELTRLRATLGDTAVTPAP